MHMWGRHNLYVPGTHGIFLFYYVFMYIFTDLPGVPYPGKVTTAVPGTLPYQCGRDLKKIEDINDK